MDWKKWVDMFEDIVFKRVEEHEMDEFVQLPHHRIMCMCCKEVVESKFSRDYQETKCENGVFVDGGPIRFESRFGAKDIRKVVFMPFDIPQLNMQYTVAMQMLLQSGLRQK